ncbi:MAG: trehalose-phosphatase [Azospirillaceae bacterium]
MPIRDESRSIDPFAIDVRPRDIAVFLDVDGTLIDIAESPSAVHVPHYLPTLLADLLGRLGGAMALVSGRPLAEIDDLFRPLAAPAAGQHGLEWRRPDGTVDRDVREIRALDAIDGRLRAFVARHPGLLLEHKGMTIALHYRAAPEFEADARSLVGSIRQAFADELDVYDGKMVFEFKPAGADKGSAVRRFMAMPPFAGRRPVFVGDDTTDEYGFAAAREAAGIAVMVGDKASAQANAWLADVRAVHRLLALWSGRPDLLAEVSRRK